MIKLVQKLRFDRYFSSVVILAIDLMVSFIASISSFVLVDYLFPQIVGGVDVLLWLIASVAFSALSFFIFKTYNSIIRHSSFKEIGRFVVAVLVKSILLTIFTYTITILFQSNKLNVFLLILDFFSTLVFLIIIRVIMFIVYDMLIKQNRDKNRRIQNVLIYGTGNKSVSLVERLRSSPNYNVVGFINPGIELKNYTLAGKVVYCYNELKTLDLLFAKTDPDGILYTSQNDTQNEQEKLMKYCSEKGVKSLLAPKIDEFTDLKKSSAIREVKIEDLLGREEIKISLKEIKENFNNKTILVTGAAGSIGSELCRQLASFNVKKLVMLDNAETPLHNIRLEFEDNYPELDFVPIIGDIRIKARLDYVFKRFRPEVVFHAGAYKHVPLMEENPCEAVLVNTIGSRNIADKCIEYGVEKMVMVSTDKAVNPTNIMGCTKRLAEIYVQSLGLAIERGEIKGKTKFVTTRFGNVLGSNGSVIPRFREQIAHGGPITVTHPEITRFFMTIPEACRLVMEAATMSNGNQIFVFDMGESVKIADLARRMIKLSGLVEDKDIKIEYTGLRAGEKLYEEVLATAEDTLPTDHERINIAKVREYNYDDAQKVVDELEKLSRAVVIPDMVRLMKRTVPEFKSKNSPYEVYDKEN
ncbi:MAG: polysaccharide biosynthesis protein [Bacteroidales bacterium]|nr:polysaccharide biosynthesis protein [Bacteroidales bacterium]